MFTFYTFKGKSKEAQGFGDRKGDLSVTVLAMVDYNGKFTYVECSYPGAAVDQLIYHESTLADDINSGLAYGGLIYGDLGFPLATGILTQIPKPKLSLNQQLREKQLQYNVNFTQLRQIVEHGFGSLKRSFHIFDTPLHMSLEKVQTTIMACCVLHNLAADQQLTKLECNIDDIQRYLMATTNLDRTLSDPLKASLDIIEKMF